MSLVTASELTKTYRARDVDVHAVRGIEVHAKADATPGVVSIIAFLDGGTQYTIHL